MPGAHAIGGHRLHVERITLRDGARAAHEHILVKNIAPRTASRV